MIRHVEQLSPKEKENRRESVAKYIEELTTLRRAVEDSENGLETFETQLSELQAKRPYEKPVMRGVMLFAMMHGIAFLNYVHSLALLADGNLTNVQFIPLWRTEQYILVWNLN